MASAPHTEGSHRSGGVRSTVSIAGHPIHPVLIPFPIAFLTAAVASDITFAVTSTDFWAEMSLWLIGAGVVTGVVAAATGLVDFLTIERARSHRTGWIHFLGNAVVLVTALANWLLRLDGAESFITPWGLILSIGIALLLMVTGWAGGELSYRHQIGVTGH